MHARARAFFMQADAALILRAGAARDAGEPAVRVGLQPKGNANTAQQQHAAALLVGPAPFAQPLRQRRFPGWKRYASSLTHAAVHLAAPACAANVGR